MYKTVDLYTSIVMYNVFCTYLFYANLFYTNYMHDCLFIYILDIYLCIHVYICVIFYM